MDTMKPQYRTYVQVMLLSLACVILIWLADTVLDARYTSQTLWQSLLSLRPHEYILRGILVFLGLMVAMESTVLWEARARVRRQLEESEAKYRALFEAAPAGVLLELLDGTIVECNDRAAEMLGYTKEELCGKRAADVVPPEIAQTFPAFVERELRDGWAMVEAKAKRKDGSIFPTEVGTRLVHLAGVPYVVGRQGAVDESHRRGADRLAPGRGARTPHGPGDAHPGSGKPGGPAAWDAGRAG
jgi:PAS domain S-box-containing protein